MDKYVKPLSKLLPRGKAFDWIRESDLVRALAIEFERLETRAKDFTVEITPDQATELLEDWESLLGLPDVCTPPAADTGERRSQAAAKLANTGGISKQFFEELGESFGFEVQVEKARAFRAGRSRATDRLRTPFRRQLRAGSLRAGESLNEWGWRFAVVFTLPLTSVELFRAGSGRAGDSLASYANPLLECFYESLKPAHVRLHFRFEEI